VVAVLLGLLVAATYGAADFFGGLSSRRAGVPSVVVFSQLCGLPVLAVLVLTTQGQLTLRTAVLGAAAGAIGGVGLTCLYRGLASGRMSVIAPITAVGAAIVPVLWGLLQGERPGVLALIGVALAVAAIALVSRSADLPPSRDGEPTEGNDRDRATPVLLLAVVAGMAFGAVFVLLAETGDDAGFWPLVAGRSSSIVLLTVASLLAGRRVIAPGRRAMATIAPAGVLDMAANAVYLLAARRGLLALVAVLSALYPASTVLLARIVLEERLTRLQIGGLVLAGTGVVLIAAG